MSRYILTTLVVLLIGFNARAQTNAPIVYPSKGQTTQQQAKDEGECRSWAQQQTGFTGQRPSQPQAAGNRGRPMIRGSARGAALGAVGGAIGGDAGRGAAIGAGVGAASGLLRRGRARRQQETVARSADTQYQAAQQNYYRAFSACMNGRGYTVS